MPAPPPAPGAAFLPTGDSFETSDVATLLILTGASDADKTGHGDGRGGGRRSGNIQAWIRVPLSRHVWGTAGWKNAPGDAGWPGFGYCQEGEISFLPRLLCCHISEGARSAVSTLAESFAGILSLSIHCSGRRGLVETPPNWAVEAGGPGGPEAYFPVSPKPSKHAPSRPDALLDPNALCHREPGTEPAFFISSHLLWQPRVCLVFTSRDAWKLSLLDHTRGASQHFPSSADIFLVMSVVSTTAFPPELSQEQQGSSCS